MGDLVVIVAAVDRDAQVSVVDYSIACDDSSGVGQAGQGIGNSVARAAHEDPGNAILADLVIADRELGRASHPDTVLAAARADIPAD
jgi:hypothetical protein